MVVLVGDAKARLLLLKQRPQVANGVYLYFERLCSPFHGYGICQSPHRTSKEPQHAAFSFRLQRFDRQLGISQYPAEFVAEWTARRLLFMALHAMQEDAEKLVQPSIQSRYGVPMIAFKSLVASLGLLMVFSAMAKEVVIDVRTAQEFQAGHIPGALHIEHTQIAQQIFKAKVSKDDQVILYCRSGRRSGLALDTLKQMGFTNAKNYGGMEEARKRLQK